MAACAYQVTSEYEDGTASETYRVMPHRALALLVKTVLFASSYAVLALVLFPFMYVLTESIGTKSFAYPGIILGEGGLRAMLTVPIVVWCLCIIAGAIGSMIRNSAIVIALLLIWAALLEDLIGRIPGVGATIAALLPVNNGWALTGVQETIAPPWPAWFSAIYLVAWMALFTGAACWLLGRRDVPARS